MGGEKQRHARTCLQVFARYAIRYAIKRDPDKPYSSPKPAPSHYPVSALCEGFQLAPRVFFARLLKLGLSLSRMFSRNDSRVHRLGEMDSTKWVAKHRRVRAYSNATKSTQTLLPK